LTEGGVGDLTGGFAANGLIGILRNPAMYGKMARLEKCERSCDVTTQISKSVLLKRFFLTVFLKIKILFYGKKYINLKKLAVQLIYFKIRLTN
jgi:hypothetical protein